MLIIQIEPNQATFRFSAQLPLTSEEQTNKIFITNKSNETDQQES